MNYPEPVRRLVADIMQEHARALTKSPSSSGSMVALTEEAGELAEALTGYLVALTAHQGRLARTLLHRRPNDGGDATWAQVRAEAVQVAVMAMRVALEGDPSLQAVPAPGELERSGEVDEASASDDWRLRGLGGCGLERSGDIFAAPPATGYLDELFERCRKWLGWKRDGDAAAAMRTIVQGLHRAGWSDDEIVAGIQGKPRPPLPAPAQDPAAWATVNDGLTTARNILRQVQLNDDIFAASCVAPALNMIQQALEAHHGIPALAYELQEAGKISAAEADRIIPAMHVDTNTENLAQRLVSQLPRYGSLNILRTIIANMKALGWTEAVICNVIIGPATSKPTMAEKIAKDLRNGTFIGVPTPARPGMTEALEITEEIMQAADQAAENLVQDDPVPDGVVAMSVASSAGRYTASKGSDTELYTVEDDAGNPIADDHTALDFLRLAGILDQAIEEAVKTPRGLCRVSGAGEAWSVEQWTGKRWTEIAGGVPKRFAEGVYQRRMNENFPLNAAMKQLRERNEKLAAALREILEAADGPADGWWRIRSVAADVLAV